MRRAAGKGLTPASTGFYILGAIAVQTGGWVVSTAGDINKDGFDDFIIGQSGFDNFRGKAFVLYGGARTSFQDQDYKSSFPNTMTTGFTITGSASGDSLGCSVSTAGDFDKDGYDDIVIGASSMNSGQGGIYVIYGADNSGLQDYDFSSAVLDPLNTGFKITGNGPSDFFGSSVSTAGDLDGDGYADIIIGAPEANTMKGTVYVIYGGDKSSMLDIDLSSAILDPLVTGFTITGSIVGEKLGVSVSSAGDINNDGFDDIIIGAPNKNSNQGVVYVIYGKAKSSLVNIDLSGGLDPKTTGFMITGGAVGDNFGTSVSTAGDINNDGYSDMVIGASGRNNSQGAVYVVYGGPTSFFAHLDLSSKSLDPSGTGFVITGNAPGDYFGTSVAKSGDLNEDGYDDIIAGAHKKNTQGTAYVIYGSMKCPVVYCSSCTLTSCSSCYAGYALSNGLCESCSSNCDSCTIPSTCDNCTSPYFLYKSQCVPTCPNVTFVSGDICEDCPQYCSTCISKTSCQSCDPGYTLSGLLCIKITPAPVQPETKATQAVSSVTSGIGSVLCIGSPTFPISALVSKIVQNTRYMNISVSDDLIDVFQSWDTELISWEFPNSLNETDRFKGTPPLFAQYELGSAFLDNFWSTMMTLGVSLAGLLTCFMLKILIEKTQFRGWFYSLVQKLFAGFVNFTIVQAYGCLDDILFYFVLDVRTNPFNSGIAWASFFLALGFMAVGGSLIYFNIVTVFRYQRIKTEGLAKKNMQDLDAFNENNKYWELFYSEFNDVDMWSHSFLALLVARSSLSSLIITVFYEYTLMQTTLLVILDGCVLLFLSIKKPFMTLRATLSQYFFEIITLLVHTCTFILSMQDSEGDDRLGNFKTVLSTCIMYLNTALVTGAIGFMFIEIYETIREKQKNRHEKLNEEQGIIEAGKSQNQGENCVTKISPKTDNKLQTTELNLVETNIQQTISIENLNSPSRFDQSRSRHASFSGVRILKPARTLDLSMNVDDSMTLQDMETGGNEINRGHQNRSPKVTRPRNRTTTKKKQQQQNLDGLLLRNPTRHLRDLKKPEAA